MSTESDRMRYLAGQTYELGLSNIENVAAIEQAGFNINAALGAPGTYPGSPGYDEFQQQLRSSYTNRSGEPGDVLPFGNAFIYKPKNKKQLAKKLAGKEYSKKQVIDPNSIFREDRTSSPGGKRLTMPGPDRKALNKFAANIPIIDPSKLAARTAQTTQFQMVSQATAEAQQLVNREGPLYERMWNSITGPLVEGASRLMDAGIEELRLSYAKGGSARSEALRDALGMRAQVETNERISNALSTASLELDQFARQTRDSQLAFNQAWTQNLFGVRATYESAMSAAIAYMGGTTIPTAAKYTATADQLSYKAKTNWLEVGLGAVLAIGGAILTVGSFGAFSALGVPLMASGLSMVGSGISNKPSGGNTNNFKISVNPYKQQPASSVKTGAGGGIGSPETLGDYDQGAGNVA